MSSKVEIPSLYLCKFIMSVMVIIIHSSVFFPREIYSFILPICRVAVPVFFMISGYFSDSLLIRRRLIIWRVLKICLVATIFWFTYYLIVKGDGYVEDRINLDAFFGFLLFNIPFFGNHLWYLYAIFIVYLFFPILQLLLKKEYVVFVFRRRFIIVNYLLITCFFLLFCSILCGISRTWLFTGIPFFLLGRYLFDNKDYFVGVLSNVFLFGLMFFTIILLFFEYQFTVFPKSDLYLANIFLSILIFLIFIKNSDWGKNSICFKIGKRDTLYIYIFHIIFISLVKTMFIHIFPYYSYYLQYMFVFTIPLILVMSILFSRFLLICQDLLNRKI